MKGDGNDVDNADYSSSLRLTDSFDRFNENVLLFPPQQRGFTLTMQFKSYSELVTWKLYMLAQKEFSCAMYSQLLNMRYFKFPLHEQCPNSSITPAAIKAADVATSDDVEDGHENAGDTAVAVSKT